VDLGVGKDLQGKDRHREQWLVRGNSEAVSESS
jgi:hypothetical protein